MKQQFNIRAATVADAPLILQFIRELAAYEKLAHEVTATEDSLRRTLFGPRPAAEVILAGQEDDWAGFAVFFHNFSTFVGKPGLYLEDIFVRPRFRRRGCGQALMIYLARLALQRDCGRFEWWVLDWNQPSLDFYRSLGSLPMSDWTVHRLSGQALQDLAARASDKV